MLSYTDLKKGVLFLKDGVPFEVLQATFTRMQQRRANVEIRARNLVSGKVYEMNLQPSETFAEADVVKRLLLFLYAHRGEYVFCDPQNRKLRFSLSEEHVGDAKKWLNILVSDQLSFSEEQIDIFRSTGELFFIAAIDAIHKNSLDLKLTLDELKTKLNISGKKLFMPVRLALTGETDGPELIHIANLLGQEKILERLSHIIKILR